MQLARRLQNLERILTPAIRTEMTPDQQHRMHQIVERMRLNPDRYGLSEQLRARFGIGRVRLEQEGNVNA